MKKVLLFAAAAIAIHANAQINFGEAPQIKKEVKPIVYDGKHNIDLQNNNGEYNLSHLIGQNVTYLGINDKTEFYTNNLSANSEESYWPYKDLEASTMRLKSFRVVDAGLDVLCLFEPGKTDSIFASGDLNTNFIVQKHYDLAKSTCVGKTYRATGLSRRLDFFRDYVTRKPHNASHNNNIPRTEDLSTSAELFYVIPDGKTLQAIPYEVGLIKEHKNKFGDIASKVGKIADAAGILGSVGVIAGANIGSLNTALGGIKVMSTAGSVADVAEITNSLAGAEGHDFTYDGANAKTIVKRDGKDLKIIANIQCTNKETALGVFKVVRFKTTKKDRRLRWFQTKAALIGTSKSEEADKAGYLSFGYQNYGDHSTMLTIPASQLEPGEYGIYFLANMFEPNLAIRCYTFSLE